LSPSLIQPTWPRSASGLPPSFNPTAQAGVETLSPNAALSTQGLAPASLYRPRDRPLSLNGPLDVSDNVLQVFPLLRVASGPQPSLKVTEGCRLLRVSAFGCTLLLLKHRQGFLCIYVIPQ
jgi:hypothetical protein